MTTPLVTMLRESCGYLEDAGFHQTARLMILAASEIEELHKRIRQLEDEMKVLPGEDGSAYPEASNQNGERVAARARR